jgi:hypothetical protein
MRVKTNMGTFILSDGQNTRRDEWTHRIAVGSGSFVEKAKELLVFRALEIQGIARGAISDPLSGAGESS